MKKYVLKNKNTEYEVYIEDTSITIFNSVDSFEFDIRKGNSPTKILFRWQFFMLLLDESIDKQSTDKDAYKIYLDVIKDKLEYGSYNGSDNESIKKQVIKLNKDLSKTQIKISITNQKSYSLNFSVLSKKEDDLLNTKMASLASKVTFETKEIIPQILEIKTDGMEESKIFSIDEIVDGYYFFDAIDEKKRLLISSPGGQGKTRLLKIIKESALVQNLYSHIIYIYLPSLLSNIIIDDISIEEYPLYYLFDRYMKSNNLSYEDLLKKCIKSNERGRTFKKVLILFDDYNGLISSPNSIIKDNIRSSIEEVANNWTNTTIIMTTRDSTYKNNNEYKNYNEAKAFKSIATLSDVPKEASDSVIKKYNIDSDELKKLIRVPMYFIMLNSLDYSVKPSNIYELFDCCLYRIANQRINKTTYYDNKSLLLFIYYVVLPCLAQYMNSKLLRVISDKEYNKCIDEMFDKENYCNLIFQYFCTMNNHQNDYRLPIYNEKNLQAIRNLLFDSEYINYENGRLSFVHDNWQDFFCAKNILNNITILKENYKDSDISREIDINLNVNNYVSDMIKNVLGFIPNTMTQDALSIVVSKYEEIFIEFINNNSFELNPNTIYGTVEFFNLAFLIRDYLKLESMFTESEQRKKFLNDIEEKKHSILSVLIKFLLDNKEYKKLIRENCNIEHLMTIISSEVAYFRKHYNLAEAEEIVCLGYGYNKNSSEIIHHDAKLHLCHFQKEFDKNKVDKKLFSKSFKLLKENAINNNFYLSANLYGKFVTSPSPFLLANKFVDVDPVSAFYSYFFATCPSNDNGRIRIARDSEYTLRQALALLLKGYVKVSNKDPYIKGTYKINQGQIVIGDLNACNINKSTLYLANDLYKLIEGQSSPFLNFLRNQLNWHTNDKKLLSYEFLSNLPYEIFKLPYYLQRKYLLKDETISFYISEAYKELTDKIISFRNNDIEIYHPIYQYLDCKFYELSFQDDANKNKFIKEMYSFDDCDSSIKAVIDLFINKYF